MDYEKMYFKLAGIIANITEQLVQAQQDMEEEFITHRRELQVHIVNSKDGLHTIEKDLQK